MPEHSAVFSLMVTKEELSLYLVNRCGIDVSRFGSLVFQRQSSVTPMRDGMAESRFESWISSLSSFVTSSYGKNASTEHSWAPLDHMLLIPSV